MGRATEGVRGIRLSEEDFVVGMVVARPDSTLLVVTEKGMGKRTDPEAYRLQGRGGKGVINQKLSDRTGKVVAIKAVAADEQLMVITKKGVVNRQRVADISLIGRATQGVKLVNLDKGDVVMDVARVIVDDDDVEYDEDGNPIEPVEGEGGTEGDGIAGSLAAGDEDGDTIRSADADGTIGDDEPGGDAREDDDA